MTYKAAEKLIKIHAEMKDLFVKKGRNRMGKIGYMIADAIADKIVAGDGYTFDIHDCANYLGVKIPNVLED